MNPSQNTESENWRENLHQTVKAILGHLPNVVVNAIDSAYTQGLVDQVKREEEPTNLEETSSKLVDPGSQQVEQGLQKEKQGFTDGSQQPRREEEPWTFRAKKDTVINHVTDVFNKENFEEVGSQQVEDWYLKELEEVLSEWFTDRDFDKDLEEYLKPLLSRIALSERKARDKYWKTLLQKETDLHMEAEEQARRDERQKVLEDIDEYFKGLIVIPDPQATLNALKNQLTKEE